MRKFFLITGFLTSAMGLVQAQKSNDEIERHQLRTVSLLNVNGYLEFLPADYEQNNDTYPLLLFLHGRGERGNGNTELYRVAKHGPPKEIERDANVDMCFGGECFIVISPQLPMSMTSWGAAAVNSVLDYVLENYRVDHDRIYLTGFSLGGIGTYKYAYNSLNFPNKLAAIAPVAANAVNASQGCTISERKIPVSAFHSKMDEQIGYSNGLACFNAIAECTDPTPTADLLFTTYPTEDTLLHNETPARVYKTDHTYHNPNVYEWLLSHTLSNDGNQPPVADAGPDITENLPLEAITINGTGTDSDGSVASYSWAQVSGDQLTMAGSNTADLTLSDLVAGTFEFSLTVTDDDGATASDQVLVTIDAGAASGTLTEKLLASKNLPYLEYLPAGYDPAGSACPVLIYLHSEDAEGTDLDLVKQEGPLYYFTQNNADFCFSANGSDECFIIIAPQVNAGDGFWKGKINALYDEVIGAYNSDPDRIYLTGFDGGGADIYARILDAKDRYAGIAVTGAKAIGNSSKIGEQAPNLWLSHGDADTETSYTAARDFFDEIRLANATGDMHFETYAGASHDESWQLAYDPANSPLYTWLLDHTVTGSAPARTSTPPATVSDAPLMVFPNPFRQYLNLTGLGAIDGEVTLYSLSGKQFSPLKVDHQVFDTDGIPRGIYLLKISSAGTTRYFKVRKQ